MSRLGASALVVCGVLVGGCCSSGAAPSEPVPVGPVKEAPVHVASASRVRLVRGAEGEPAGFSVVARSPRARVLAGRGEVPAGATLMSELGEGDVADKLGGLTQLLAAIDRALDDEAGEVTVAGFLKLDRATAPAGDDALRAALAALGYTAQTISGDIVTGRARVATLGELLAAPWVRQLEVAGSVLPRTEP